MRLLVIILAIVCVVASFAVGRLSDVVTALSLENENLKRDLCLECYDAGRSHERERGFIAGYQDCLWNHVEENFDADDVCLDDGLIDDMRTYDEY